MNKWNLKTEIQPMREESNYYDTESGLYYANGSYYDSTVGLHVDAVKISSVIENAFEIFGLDINGIMCDNILAYLPNVYSIFTVLDLSENPGYDPDANKPWWELAWNAVMRWFASILQAYNDLGIGWKIGIGLILFAIACIITAVTTVLTGGTAAAALIAIRKMTVTFLIGIAISMEISRLMALINGESLPDALLNGLADGIFWGGVFAFVSASVNAIKVLRIRAKVKRAAQEYMRLQNALVDSAKDLKNNKFVTAAYDAKTKTFQYGVNSGLKNSGEVLNAELAKLAPRLSCAETQAVNSALNSGSKLKNLYLYTVNISGKAAYACKTCTRVYGNTVAFIFSGLYK